MSWASLGNNDFVTNNNLQDAVTNGVFTLKPSQTIPANNSFATKAEIEALVNATISSGASTDFPIKSAITSSGPVLSSISSYYHPSNRWVATLGVTLCLAPTTLYSDKSPDDIFAGDSVWLTSGGTGVPTNGYYAMWSSYYASWVTIQTSSGVVSNVWIGNPTLKWKRSYGIDTNYQGWLPKYDLKHLPWSGNPDNNPGFMNVFTVEELGGWAAGSQVFMEYDGCSANYEPGNRAYFAVWDVTAETEDVIITDAYGVILGVNTVISILQPQVLSSTNSDPYLYNDGGVMRWSIDIDYNFRFGINSPLSSNITIYAQIYQYFGDYTDSGSSASGTILAGNNTVDTYESRGFNVPDDNHYPDYTELIPVSFDYSGWEIIIIET